MKTLFLAIAIMSVSLMSNAQTKKQPTKQYAARMLRHAVLFKFKDSSTPEDIKKVEAAFRRLPSQIKEINSLEWGTNNSPENLNQGFTHMFFLTFKTEADRASYLPHPAHKAFGGVLGPHLDKVLVLDYWTEN
jgi:hypothetical protein